MVSFASNIFVNTMPCTDLEWIGSLCNLFYLKKFVRILFMSIRYSSFMNIFQSLTQINLLFLNYWKLKKKMVGLCDLFQHCLVSFHLFCKSPLSDNIQFNSCLISNKCEIFLVCKCIFFLIKKKIYIYIFMQKQRKYIFMQKQRKYIHIYISIKCWSTVRLSSRLITLITGTV